MLHMKAAIWMGLNIQTNFLISYTNQAITPFWRDSATKSFESFVDQKPQLAN